jgi:hypothetical protein
MPNTPPISELRARLQTAVESLRADESVNSEVRQSLTDLLAELDRALAAPATPPAEVARLAEGAVHVAESLRHGDNRGLVESARDRLEGLVVGAENRAPTVVTLARTFIEALSDLGI